MHFVIHCLDKPDALPTRLAIYDEHKAYLQSATIKQVVSGPLVADDGETPVGSFLLVEAEDRAEVKAFHQGDPFYKAGIWERVEIRAFLKRIDNR